jgi:hypothetical protein
MVALSALWLPILLSAVFVFIASSIIHMALSFWHKGDFIQVPSESKALDALRPLAIPPGDYMMPKAGGMAEMKTPEFAEKLKNGPVIVMTVLPSGPFSMGAQLGQWFLFSVVMSFFAAYVTSHAVPAGGNYLHVFRFAGTTAFLGYAAGQWPFSIWYRRSWITTIKGTIDGLLYACLTAGTLGWLWPK